MRRSAMMAGGTVLGVAGVIALPHPSTPQQVAVAGNAAATTRSASKAGSTAAAAAGTAKAASAQTASTAPATKTVTGTLVTDQYGQLQVKLTIRSGRVTKVGFTTFVANDGRSMQIDQSAAPVLIRETFAAQSAQIQGVCGATYTSNSYQQSLQAAIDKAGLKA
ncbi:MAG: hypothetical protein QOI17_1903 [Gaiellales bacterium]|nr:hypothetical protein [Gaiellales bacterium]